MSKNSCDGCLAGKPIDDQNRHTMSVTNGYRDKMYCEKYRYLKPIPWKTTNGIVSWARIGSCYFKLIKDSDTKYRLYNGMFMALEGSKEICENYVYRYLEGRYTEVIQEAKTLKEFLYE